MTYEIREFDIDSKGPECIWKFKLGNPHVNQIEFYGKEQSLRSLFHLANDFLYQIESNLNKKKKKIPPKDRIIRKLCEKMLKSLRTTLKIFANDIEERHEHVLAYFEKKELSEDARQRIQVKCQKWIIQAWLSLSPENYFNGCQKYIQSLFKDGKRISPDFELLNQFYLVIEGDNFNPDTLQKTNQSLSMILIDINLSIGHKYISESFLWNPQITSKIKIDSFLRHFLTDIFFEKEIDMDQQNLDQIIDECRVQIRTQSLYKSLLKKHTNILLNFSTLQISQDVRQYLIEIDFKLSDEKGEIFYSDCFQWDILSQLNSVEDFCTTLMEDEGIPSKHFSQMCYKIKTQINAELQWKFTMLVKTFKSIHKDRQSPKLNTQTMTQLKKNIIYTMDVNIPFNPEKQRLPRSIYLNNSDLFSTLSRNIDILPEQFQEILQCKQTYRGNDKQGTFENSNKTLTEEFLKEKCLKLEDNNYLGKFTSLYKANSLWRRQLRNQTKDEEQEKQIH